MIYRTTTGLSNPASRYMSSENDITNSKICLHHHVLHTIIYNSEDMETCPSADEWMKIRDRQI